MKTELQILLERVQFYTEELEALKNRYQVSDGDFRWLQHCLGMIEMANKSINAQINGEAASNGQIADIPQGVTI